MRSPLLGLRLLARSAISSKPCFTAGLIMMLSSIGLHADDRPYLVRDLPGLTVKDSLASGVFNWTTIGNTSWFVASTSGTESRDVFKTDGTAAGTVRLTYGEGAPGDGGTGPFLGTIHGKLVYQGKDSDGDGIFALDATGGAPVLLARAKARALDADSAVLGDRLYFGASKVGEYRTEIWSTDGTAAGTGIVDLLPGEKGALDYADHSPLFGLGGWLYFYGSTTEGTGLHRTDGTAANTTLIMPLTVTELFNDAHELSSIGNRLIFHLSGVSGRLFVSDGTASGTKLLAEVYRFSRMGMTGGKLMFEGEPGQIWTTDGSPEGTQKTDLFAGERRSVSEKGAVIGNDLYFFATRFGDDESLYVTRGTPATTREIVQVHHGSAHFLRDGFVLGGRFLYHNSDSLHGSELWSTDGITTELVSEINPGSRSGIWGGLFAEVRPDGKAIFPGREKSTGIEPWITDGTAAGTHILVNVAPEDGINGSSPRLLRASGDHVFFTASLTGDTAVGVSDGTGPGTSATLVDYWWTIGSAATAGGHYFFSEGSGPSGLFATDSTLTGPTRLYDGAPTPLTLGNGVLFEENRSAVWFSDGTASGTHKLLQGVDDLQIFPAPDVALIASGARLWKTDGTVTGTTEISTGEANSRRLYSAIRSGNTFFILGFDNDWVTQLRVSDTTATGTHLVKTFGRSSNSVEFAGATDHLAYFTYFVNGERLGRSDGTEQGTFDVASLPACPGTALGDNYYFVSITSKLKDVMTLWRTDGTAAGTTALVTMTTRPMLCQTPVVFGKTVYFSGWDPAHGWEPWVTDGTVAGTKMVADLSPGKTSSSPKELTVAGQRLFFTADHPNVGRELWAIGPHASSHRRSVGSR